MMVRAFHTKRCKICGELWHWRKGTVTQWMIKHLLKHGIVKEEDLPIGNIAEYERKYFEYVAIKKNKR